MSFIHVFIILTNTLQHFSPVRCWISGPDALIPAVCVFSLSFQAVVLKLGFQEAPHPPANFIEFLIYYTHILKNLITWDRIFSHGR